MLLLTLIVRYIFQVPKTTSWVTYKQLQLFVSMAAKTYSSAGHLVILNLMSIVFDLSVCKYVCVCVYIYVCEGETRAVFRGCKSDFFLDFVIHTYFHHWIEMWGWQQTHAILSLQCYILLQVWENVRLRDRCIPKIYVVLNIRSKS